MVAPPRVIGLRCPHRTRRDDPAGGGLDADIEQVAEDLEERLRSVARGVLMRPRTQTPGLVTNPTASLVPPMSTARQKPGVRRQAAKRAAPQSGGRNENEFAGASPLTHRRVPASGRAAGADGRRRGLVEMLHEDERTDEHQEEAERSESNGEAERGQQQREPATKPTTDHFAPFGAWRRWDHGSRARQVTVVLVELCPSLGGFLLILGKRTTPLPDRSGHLVHCAFRHPGCVIDVTARRRRTATNAQFCHRRPRGVPRGRKSHHRPADHRGSRCERSGEGCESGVGPAQVLRRAPPAHAVSPIAFTLRPLLLTTPPEPTAAMPYRRRIASTAASTSPIARWRSSSCRPESIASSSSWRPAAAPPVSREETVIPIRRGPGRARPPASTRERSRRSRRRLQSEEKRM